MKQIMQNMHDGSTVIVEAPAPLCRSGHLLINSTASLISSGTERSLVNFGKANYIDKARQQPEKVKMVLEKIKTDGLATTIDAVKSKLDTPLPLGYSNVGVVAEVGSGVSPFKVGDRVVSNGHHADVVCVPKNLCARVPDTVSDEEAAFTVVASIGLQGIRLVQPTLGESVAVIGVGLIGLIVVQLLKAQGCRVLAIDYDSAKLALAKQFGAEVCNLSEKEDPVNAGLAFSHGEGMDGVIITASTQSNDPVVHAARMSRKRGRIVLVGMAGLQLNRADFYDKELTFQVSCSYGPGRYDPNYEDMGNDYPVGFVRWTEQRNFEAVLELMSAGSLDVKPLISHRFAFESALDAYQQLSSNSDGLGILLSYASDTYSRHQSVVNLDAAKPSNGQKAVLGFLGAGNYASRILIPAFKSTSASLNSVVTSSGVTASVQGQKFGFLNASSDIDSVLKSDAINVVVITTRHNSHAQLTIKAMQAGKHVFVEKPLAITLEQLDEVIQAYNESRGPFNTHLMVGFNRRFSPHIKKMKRLLSSVRGPKTFNFTMNAGNIPSDHWVQDPEIGGGRIIGEACHYIDLMRYLADSDIVSVQARRMGENNFDSMTEDKAVILLGFADGSVGTIHYFANGAASFPKERIEVFAQGKVLQLDNFITLKGYGFDGFKKLRLWRQDKGQSNCCSEYVQAIEKGEEPLIPPEQLFEVSRVTIEVAMSLRAQV
jgi:predicted dehydrogenase